MERTPRLGVSKEGIRQCGCRLLSMWLRPQREAEHMAGGWFLTREGGSCSQESEDLYSPEEVGEEARLMNTSAPPPRGWARQEAGGKAAAEVSLLLMKILRGHESSTLRGVWGNLGVAQNNELL